MIILMEVSLKCHYNILNSVVMLFVRENKGNNLFEENDDVRQLVQKP